MAITSRENKQTWSWAAAALVLLANPLAGRCGSPQAGPERSEGPGETTTWRLETITEADVLALASAPLMTPSSAETGGGQPTPGDAAKRDSINVSKAGTVEMHVANLPLSTVLETLSIQSRRNIIATPSVTGTVTAYLFNVTFEEALRAGRAGLGKDTPEAQALVKQLKDHL